MGVLSTVLIFLIITILTPQNTALFFNKNSGSNRICIINANDCNSNVNVCGRLGRSNLCARFRNSCALQTNNCNRRTAYSQVSNSFCTGIPLNNRRACNGLPNNGGLVVTNTNNNNLVNNG